METCKRVQNIKCTKVLLKNRRNAETLDVIDDPAKSHEQLFRVFLF